MKNINQLFNDFWKSNYRWLIPIVILIVFIFGYLSRGCGGISHSDRQRLDFSEQKTDAIEMWTCSMHPQIKQPKPGKCPICSMDLVPVNKTDSDEQGERELKLSERGIMLAGIQTVPVKKAYVAAEIRMVGKVTTDESRLKIIAARVPGRVDRLYVDFTGIQVKKGDHLVSLYSPQLITAQQELIEARKMSPRTLEAVREKLRLWGLTGRQIREIEKKGKTTNHLTVFSPGSGIVVQKNVSEGQYVKTGTRIYTIADLSVVWVKLDAYESDLSWIRYGQSVEFETEAYPGQKFIGKIAFIDPVLNQQTRTVKVRVNVENSDMRLKPDMFVRATVYSKLSASGKVMDEDLVGKWISPMHPEIVKDGPGSCDICGMPLVPAEKLGYVNEDRITREMPLVIPASAPLLTGTRAVVYISLPGKKGHFEGREVILGPRAGEFYMVKQGLKEGDLVVVNGAFKLDSDLQIQAKPSMMSFEGGLPMGRHHHGPVPKPAQHKQSLREQKHETHQAPDNKDNDIPESFRKSLDAVVVFYFDIQQALSSDDVDRAVRTAGKLLKKLAEVDMNILKGAVHMEWMKQEQEMKASGQKLAKADDIGVARVQFEKLTAAVTRAVKTFGSKEAEIYQFHCPMAFNNKGAFWLQNNPDTRNPYFGKAMLTCKDAMEKLMPVHEKQK